MSVPYASDELDRDLAKAIVEKAPDYRVRYLIARILIAILRELERR